MVAIFSDDLGSLFFLQATFSFECAQGLVQRILSTRRWAVKAASWCRLEVGAGEPLNRMQRRVLEEAPCKTANSTRNVRIPSPDKMLLH